MFFILGAMATLNVIMGVFSGFGWYSALSVLIMGFFYLAYSIMDFSTSTGFLVIGICLEVFFMYLCITGG